MAHKVLIGIPTAEMARNSIFYDHLGLLERPDNAVQIAVHGQSPARNRNLIIEKMLSEPDFTHILFLDDDVLVPPDMLIRLLSHDKDIVSGLYLMRNFPHRPILFSEARLSGHCLNTVLVDGMEGLIPIVNCGLGAVLIKREVFEAMEKPWITLGELEADHWCDDISFFNRVRAKGFELFCDLDVLCGHCASVTVAPTYQNGKWYTTYDSYGIMKLTIPQLTPDNIDQMQGANKV